MDFWTYEYMNIIPFAPVSGLPQGGGGSGIPIGIDKKFQPKGGELDFWATY